MNTLLNVDLPSEDVTAFKAALINQHIVPVASCELKVGNRKGFVTLIVSVQGYSHKRISEALHASSASIVAVLLPNGQRFTCGKATLLREVTARECEIKDLWGQPC